MGKKPDINDMKAEYTRLYYMLNPRPGSWPILNLTDEQREEHTKRKDELESLFTMFHINPWLDDPVKSLQDLLNEEAAIVAEINKINGKIAVKRWKQRDRTSLEAELSKLWQDHRSCMFDIRNCLDVPRR